MNLNVLKLPNGRHLCNWYILSAFILSYLNIVENVVVRAVQFIRVGS